MKLMRQARRMFSGAYVNHRDRPFNNPLTPFDFTQENYEKISKILKKYPPNYKGSAVKALLYLAQDQNDNWIPLTAMRKIAKILEIPAMQVYEVATFYTMFNREPVGKFHLQVCGTTPCLVSGSRNIMKAITEEVGIRVGETSKDGLFTMTEVECLGACVNAPMIQVNGKEVYEDLTPESMKNIIRCFREGKQVQGGPQNGRKNSEGPQGRTSLKEIPLNIVCRDFDQLKASVKK